MIYLKKLPINEGDIMGGNMNVAIGIGDFKELSSVLGPHGLAKRN
jgi:hypothetical protein